MSRPLTTSIMIWPDRYLPAETVPAIARVLADSGVVDDFTLPDHLNGMVPQKLWTLENTPVAALAADGNSLHDAFVMGALAHAAAPELGLVFTTDAIRRAPIELNQTMMTFGAITGGRVKFMYGAGEFKQCKGYGHKRSQGLARQEDMLRTFRALWSSTEPVNLDGHHTTLQQASLGGARAERPTLWTLGTGPRQLDLATTYMDGVTCLAPFGWATPEEAGRDIATVRAQLAAKGRDPESFGFGLHTVCLIHEDQAVLDRALDNPVLRWIAGVYGRVNPANWRNEGIEPVTPDGWSYFMKYSPSTATDEFVDGVVSNCTRRMAERAYLAGDVATVTARIQEYIDAGVDWVAVNDLAPLVLPLEEGQASIGRMLGVCGALKAHAAQRVAAGV